MAGAMKHSTRRSKRSPKQSRKSPALTPILAAVLLTLGYYLGSQRQLIALIDIDSTSLAGPLSTQVMQSTLGNQVANGNREKIGYDTKASNIFRLHPNIGLSEDPELYRNLVHPRVRTLVEHGNGMNCPFDEVKPYLDILRNIDENPLFYEDDNSKNINQTCPLVFLFYFEGGSKMAETFFDYYSNIKTKRCLNFIVSGRWINKPGTKESAEKNGYTIVGRNYLNQDKTISMSLWDIKKQYGDDVLVSVNDLDHLLVWFDHFKNPHRYSSYTDMVRLYAYRLLSTKGCPDTKNVWEKYVVPCTCLMEQNQNYTSTAKDGVIWLQYGDTNRFHPTANFYLNRSLSKDSAANYAYSIGTVFANLRNYTADIITHHKIAYKVKKTFSQARMAGVIHARSDNMIQSLTKYQHFLNNGMKLNGFRKDDVTISDAMGCAVVDTYNIIANEKSCRTVKEFANILAIGHQKLACLNVGYSEEQCMADLSCCLTY